MRLEPINFADWYWLADSGQIYSSRVGGVIAATDPGYAAFLASDRTPTVWPRDASGAQTDAALAPVLAFYGVGPAPVADVSSAQAKIALSRAGHLADVKVAVDLAGGEVEIWFTDARTWQRTNPHVVAIGAALGLTSDEIDALFRQAATIAA